MKTLLPILVLGPGFISCQMFAQSVLFDFENAPVHSPLPLNVSAGGITASFSATGQGYSIQPANTMGFTPVGFSGSCIYPSSIQASDLRVSFSKPLTAFSILYAPQELACDSSARMRVTAYSGTNFVGTSTMVANAGTWPTATLGIKSTKVFDNVVVHYDAPPPTGGDWGPIFMADNMEVTPMPQPVITNVVRQASNLIITGSNGLAGGSYVVKTTSTLTSVTAEWVDLVTNTFDADGNFAATNSISGSSQAFYILQTN